MMTAARENLDPKSNRAHHCFSGLSTLHLSSSLSHRNARVPSRTISILAKDETRLLSLTQEQRHHHHHHQRDDDDKRRPSKDETTTARKENAP